MVERSIFIEASNSRWCASPRYRTSHLVVSLWWARLDLNQQCSKATDLQSAALPIPLTDPFIRLGRSNRKLLHLLVLSSKVFSKGLLELPWHRIFVLIEDLQGQNLTCRPLHQSGILLIKSANILLKIGSLVY